MAEENYLPEPLVDEAPVEAPETPEAPVEESPEVPEVPVEEVPEALSNDGVRVIGHEDGSVTAQILTDGVVVKEKTFSAEMLAEATEEANVEKPVEEKTFTQADVDKLLGASRRESREKLSSLEARVKAFEEKEEKLATAALASRLGLKESVLTKTGLKGEDLEAYAAELAEAIEARKPAPLEEKPAEKPGLKLSEIFGAEKGAGITLTPKNPANSPEAVRAALKARLEELGSL